MRWASRASALDRDHEIQQRRCAGRLQLSLDGFVDDLLYVGATTPTSQTGARRARDVTGRTGAVSDEATNLSIGDSTAMADEHRIFLSLLFILEFWSSTFEAPK